MEYARKGRPVVTDLVKFKDKLPADVKVVPVTSLDPYVVTDTTNVEWLARFIVDKATEIMVNNGYPEPNELQIGYDWEERDQEAYFDMLRDIKSILRKRDDGQLSVMVRLHQLSLETPPVDYAVLMLDNTSRTRKTNARDAILNYEAIHEALDDLIRYPLPMATTLPLYGWDLIYKNDKFRISAYGLNLNDTSRYTQLSPGVYKSKIFRSVPLSIYPYNHAGHIYPGDIIYHFEPSAGMLDSVASMISRVRPNDCSNVVLTRLDDPCIDRFHPHVYSTLFKGGSAIGKDSVVVWD